MASKVFRKCDDHNEDDNRYEANGFYYINDVDENLNFDNNEIMSSVLFFEKVNFKNSKY